MAIKSTYSYYYYGKIPDIKKNPRFPDLNVMENLVYEILLEENRRLSVAELLALLPVSSRTVRFAIKKLKDMNLIKNTRSIRDSRTHLYYIDDEK